MSSPVSASDHRMDKSAVRVRVTELVVRRRRKTIIDNLSFDVKAGEVLGLIGPNGAGKSTVLATMAGIDTPDAGTIHIDNRDITSLSASDRAQSIGWVEQLGTVHWPLSVERLIMLGRIPHLPPWGKATTADHEAVEDAIAKADCTSIRQRQVPTLSGGERARVLLARALAAEPTLLFADEPVSSLDLSHQLQTMQLLCDYAGEQRAVVVVMHDLSLAVRYCHRLVLMHKGEIVAVGEPAAVLSNQNIADVYGVSVVTGCQSVPWVVPEHILPKTD
ncbi:MAG: ABC transporter ATP-binding protein [Granulosicoccus sp.]